MKQAIVKLKSASPYSQSRYHDTEKLKKELAADYERRTWPERLHTDKNGMVYIPAIALKVALQEAAKYLSMQIPGKGKATYTKHFEAGVMPMSVEVPLGIHKDDVVGEELFLNSDGKRGGGRRVPKTYPRIEEWEAEMTFAIVDDIITEDVFKHVLMTAGQLIGIGRWRPRMGGLNGRFSIENIEWIE